MLDNNYNQMFLGIRLYSNSSNQIENVPDSEQSSSISALLDEQDLLASVPGDNKSALSGVQSAVDDAKNLLPLMKELEEALKTGDTLTIAETLSDLDTEGFSQFAERVESDAGPVWGSLFGKTYQHMKSELNAGNYSLAEKDAELLVTYLDAIIG